jgi:hypothetical protein
VKEAALRADIDRLQAEAARLLAARHLSLLIYALRITFSWPARLFVSQVLVH